jgi:tRNA dimethylallyltransferase
MDDLALRRSGNGSTGEAAVAVASAELGPQARVRAAILIHGPTASGKTALAIELARRLNGEIVNADAMQVYADLNVLTARPTPDELAQAPHHLFGHVDAARRYSVGRWLSEAREAVESVQSAGRTPIVVGGTGLYLQALVEGLAEVPPVPDAAREEARARVRREPELAWAEVARADPEAARRIQPADRQRVARALEVLLATGRPLSSFQVETAPALPAGTWTGIALTPAREAAYARIDARTDAMMRSGALEEARALWARKLEREAPAMRAHGMPGFCDYFEGRISLAEAIERCKRDTRRYAKRQMTWIAHQFPLWPRIPSEDLHVRARVAATFWETQMRRAAPAQRP